MCLCLNYELIYVMNFILQPCSTVSATTSEEGKTEDPEFHAKILHQKEGKKTWQEFKEIVCELRKQLSSLSSMAPTSIAFRTYLDGRTRIFFLGSPCNGFETTLLYADIPKDEDTLPNARLKWCPVIESIATASKFSREEQLMLERKRLATWGITSYELHEDSGKLVFPASSTLFHCTDNGFSVSSNCLEVDRAGGGGGNLKSLLEPPILSFCSNVLFSCNLLQNFHFLRTIKKNKIHILDFKKKLSCN